MPTRSKATEEFTLNLLNITEKYNLILQTIMAKQSIDGQVIDPLNAYSTLTEIMSKIMQDPEKLIHYQIDYTDHYLKLVNNVMSRFMGEQSPPLFIPSYRDYRFKDNAWNENVLFNFIKQSYLMTSEWTQKIINDHIQDVDSKTARKINFYTKQLLDALCPANFALTNPQVLKETIESNGQNLVKGMEKFLHDIENSKRFINITTTDNEAFEVGVNLATSKGQVIYQNDLMQLIHYAPLHKQHYAQPLLIVPPCINKFYILDLKENNSFIRWLLEQGYNVFIISWVNPDKTLAHKDFENYMLEGPLTAIDIINDVTGQPQVNAIGYCIGGTLLATTIAYMKAKNDHRIKAATFLTTLVDFSEAGDLSIFIDDEQLAMVEKRMSEEGFLDGTDMAAAFSTLRANDMIWNFFINNYLLGKDPMPFDLLYWNSDSTRLPAKMHSFYLRNMYQNNALIEPGKVRLNGVKIDLSLIDIPCYLLSTSDDHIAPWQSTFAATKIFSGDVTFTLSASGHIAGVINPPQSNKYCYWKNNNVKLSAGAWLKGASEHQGSWWPDWHEWHKPLAGKTIKTSQKRNYASIEEAPGSYVRVR